MFRPWVFSVLWTINFAPWRGAAQGSSTLTVTSPTSSDIFEAGEDATVEWTSTGEGTVFGIALLNDGQHVDDSFCGSAGCSASDGTYTVTLPTWLEAGRQYSFLVGDRAANPGVYGESETFEILAPADRDGGDDNELMWRIILAAAAVLAILLAGCLLARHFCRRRRKDKAPNARTQTSVADGDSTVEAAADVFYSSGSVPSEGGMSSLAGIAEMGGLSPVQEESVAIVTTNPMRAAMANGAQFHSAGAESERIKAAISQGPQFHSTGGESDRVRALIAQASPFHSTGGGSDKAKAIAVELSQFPSTGGDSMRREDDEEEEPEEGMFADAAVVAALAAAAAQRAQKPEQTPVKKSGNTTPRWGWQGSSGGWVKTTVAGQAQTTPKAGDAPTKAEETEAPEPKAPVWSAGVGMLRLASSTPTAAASPRAENRLKSPTAMAPEEPNRSSMSPLVPASLTPAMSPDPTHAVRAAMSTGTAASGVIAAAAAGSRSSLTASQQTPVAEVEEGSNTTVAADEGESSARELEPALRQVSPGAYGGENKFVNSKEQPNGFAAGSPGAPQDGGVSTMTSGTPSETEPELEIPNPGAQGTDCGSRKAEMETQPAVEVEEGWVKEPATKVAEGDEGSEVHLTTEKPVASDGPSEKESVVADVVPAASTVVRKASTLPTAPAENITAPTMASIPSEKYGHAAHVPEQHEPLRLPPKSAGSQPGTPRRVDPTTPAQQSYMSTNTSEATPDRLFVTGERSLSHKSAAWIMQAASTPNRTPRTEARDSTEDVLSSSGLGAQWATPLATPDRTPKEARSPPEGLSAQSTPADGVSRACSTPLATPDRTPRMTAPDSGGCTATPERTAMMDGNGAPEPGSAGVPASDETSFAWQLESPAGVDGLPSPNDELPGVGFKPGGRALPSIFAAIGSVDSPADGTELLTPPIPREEKPRRHGLNSSEDTNSSFAGWDVENRVASETGLGASQVAAFVAEAAADAEAESARRRRPTSLEQPKSSARNAAPSPSGVGEFDAEEVASDGAVDGPQAGGATHDPFDEAVQVAALVAETMALADKDGNHVAALYRVTGEDSPKEFDTNKSAEGDDSSPAVQANTQSKALPESVEEGRWGSGRSASDWKEGEGGQASDAERDAEEVQALVAEALALVKAAAEDGSGNEPMEG